VKTAGQKTTFYLVLKKQFDTQKELYVTPTIIILSALPETIFTFSFACTEMTYWQRHTLILAYLFSYFPQTLGFILHVLPSTSYKNEFSQTLIAKNALQWISKKKQKNAINITMTRK
jgi:hypothetical protein